MHTNSLSESRLSIGWFLIPAIIAAATLALNLQLFESLPSQLPAHFDVKGIPDRWEPKSIERMYTLPIVQVAMVILHVLIYFATTGAGANGRYQWSIFALCSSFLAVAAIGLLQAGVLFSVPYFGYLLWATLLLFILLIVWAIALAAKTNQLSR